MRKRFLFFMVFFVELIYSYDVHHCNVLRIKVSDIIEGDGLSATDVRKHVSKSVDWVNPDDHYWSCLDGRNPRAIFGTPGGDFGEFAVGVTVFDSLSNHTLNQTDVKQLFEDFMETVPADRLFYMHSDEHHLEMIRETLLHAHHGANRSEIETMEFTDVPPAWQPEVMDLLLQPKYVGCAYLQMLMSTPTDFMVRLNIIQWLMQAYFDHLWNHEAGIKLHLAQHDVLTGDHEERAVVAVDLNDDVLSASDECYGLAPEVSPKIGNESAFIYHPKLVAQTIRTKIADFLAPRVRGDRAVPSSLFLQKMNVLSSLHMFNTFRRLAVGKTVYSATVVLGSTVAEQEEDEAQLGTDMFIVLVSVAAAAVVVVVGVVLWKFVIRRRNVKPVVLDLDDFVELGPVKSRTKPVRTPAQANGEMSDLPVVVPSYDIMMATSTDALLMERDRSSLDRSSLDVLDRDRSTDALLAVIR